MTTPLPSSSQHAGVSHVTSGAVARHNLLLETMRSAGKKNLHQLFNALLAPRIDSLCGEYDGELLNQGNPLINVITKSVFRMHGNFLGKAFCPVGCSTGVGYNIFGSRETPIQSLLMETAISESELDDRLSLTISYNTKNEGLITKLYGEVRQITPNVLLGIGIASPSNRSRRIAQRKIPFLLVGPRGKFQHSGAERCQARVGPEIQATAGIVRRANELYCEVYGIAAAAGRFNKESDFQRISDLRDPVESCYGQVVDRKHQGSFTAIYQREGGSPVVHHAMFSAVKLIDQVRMATWKRPGDAFWEVLSGHFISAPEAVQRFLGSESQHDFRRCLRQAVATADRLASTAAAA